eukprot:CAMPEP_0206426984 /NCGR_PEP_ID=MMETSP0324_2-20121206/4744_1 /ASSEMBLY_ACC=CAM_ASM_000836 /TAXON_ID=2866 /ORGANISM="Crypthecodinium cohnii, Strain Seligo" /LENGTH=39 /DNA_ID= /DNA_START= /DNA_END= /DNA_ORIENTATION=
MAEIGWRSFSAVASELSLPHPLYLFLAAPLVRALASSSS